MAINFGNDIEESIISFVDRSDADLLTYYSRDTNNKITDQDFTYISDLINTFGNTERGKLNFMIHTLGGNINSTFSMVNFLKEKYPNSINTIVFRAAKSSGAFMALTANELYMQTGSILSDFALDPNSYKSEYETARHESVMLAFAGIPAVMRGEYWIQKFVTPQKVHATPIPKNELLAEGRGKIKKLSTFGCRTKPIGHVHNRIVSEMRNNPSLAKVIGINQDLFCSLV